MKKLLAVLAVAALMLTVCAPAFAAPEAPEINFVPSASYEVIAADTEDGYHVEVRAVDPEAVNEETLMEAVENSPNVQAAGEIAGLDVVDIVMVNDETSEVVEWNEPVKVVITYDKSAQVVAVFIQNDDQSWSEVPFTAGDGVLSVDLPHLTPVTFAFEQNKVAPGGNTPSNNGSKQNQNQNSGVKSPQTGYGVVLWASLAVLMVVCAAACLLMAKAKRTQ